MMAIWKNPGWFDRSQRQEQLDPDKIARYGLAEMGVNEKRDVVLHHFDRVAEKYDFMNTLLSFGLHHAWKRAAFRLLDIKSGDRIIDVCGGTGDMSVLADAAAGKTGLTVLYDINRRMMTVGRRRRSAKRPNDGVVYVQGDAECIAFPDNTFDAAMVSFGIRNLTRLAAGFSEMHRVLRSGGALLCLEFSRPENTLFRRLYDVYSFNIMPLAGQLITGSARSYACLPETIRMFPIAEELAAILEETGFAHVSYHRMLNGIAAAHIGKKL